MINAIVSDLFFNLDHAESELIDVDGDFEGYNDDDLFAEATWFCDAIANIGGPLVQPGDLVKDFLARL